MPSTAAPWQSGPVPGILGAVPCLDPIWHALQTALGDLVVPALVFALIGICVRGVAALRLARAASSEVRTNLILFVFDALVVAPPLAFALARVDATIRARGWRLFAADDWAALPAWLVVLLAVFAGDFVGYWRHRIEHSRVLWPAHAIHHGDTAMTWTTGLRFHPLNRLTTALIDTGVLACLGFPAWALLANNLVRHHYGLFIHMDLPWRYGRLGCVFVSPVMHRYHHVRDAVGAGVNFATVFSVFDQAFGTHHVPGPCNARLGVPDAIARGAGAQWLFPLRVYWAWVRLAFEPGAGREVGERA